ncbi:hypothetical protein IWQ60_010601 [Tieghemiomyces parasiticus]|uniref:Roadblock/LAMTOR2 domain-containing protein n=1 Tax=Tieghemiomyces parasiticus TaxID=78921 RepID=A0A9W7ZL87_9FUNG|nr:hypothetical protein IWQ60_010601 [Tieghemiomyces parasiticus]
MLQQATLVKVLNQALSGGVDTVALLNRKGEVHACVTNHPDGSRRGEAVAAVLSQSCVALQDAFRNNPTPDNLQQTIFLFTEGKIGTAVAGPGFLVIVASEKTPTGSIRLKLQRLQGHLEQPLSEVESNAL